MHAGPTHYRPIARPSLQLMRQCRPVDGFDMNILLIEDDRACAALTQRVLTETVPANTTFNLGASTVGWMCAPNGNAGSTCTLAIGALAANSGIQAATFSVNVANSVPGGVTQISNMASISSQTTDLVPGNDSGSDTTPLLLPTATPTITPTATFDYMKPMMDERT